MFAKTIIGGAVAAAALLAAAPAAFATDYTTTTTTPAPPTAQDEPHVQLNAATVDRLDLVNVYNLTGVNEAYGACSDGKAVFSSSALTFGDYQYQPMADVSANVAAAAKLKPGIVAGAYKLTMTCGNKTVSATFKVPGKQVVKTPVGAPQTGGGGAATVVE